MADELEIFHLFGRPDYDEAIKRLGQQDDRGAVIIVTSIFEDNLSEAIVNHFRNRDKDVEGQLLRGYGPLASLKAKIDLGFLLGMYSKEALKNLNRVREIRNRMAHKIADLSFEHQEIKDICANMPDQDKIINVWKTTRSHYVELGKQVGRPFDAAPIDRIVPALTANKKPGDRGKFMLYVHNRIALLRFFCFNEAGVLPPEIRYFVLQHC